MKQPCFEASPENIMAAPKPVRKAVFPVAGMGTRFLPATKAIPKEMLPVVDKPVIQYAVEEAREAGIEQFVFITGRGKHVIADHFDHAYELESLLEAREKTGELKQLNQQTFPGCHLAYSHPSDVARVEHLTFICTKNKEDAGPNNNWMDPAEARAKMRELFKGCMKGRTLYVVPYCMGPIDSPYSRCGVEITDSAYVVINMSIMMRMGRPALERIAREGGTRTQFV